jgi:hypothetical protein
MCRKEIGEKRDVALRMSGHLRLLSAWPRKTLAKNFEMYHVCTQLRKRKSQTYYAGAQ